MTRLRELREATIIAASPGGGYLLTAEGPDLLGALHTARCVGPALGQAAPEIEPKVLNAHRFGNRSVTLPSRPVTDGFRLRHGSRVR